MRRIRDLITAQGPFVFLVLVRIAAGVVGVGPSLVALTLLDRAAYGMAAADIAIALLALGPIGQYLTQSYLRDLMRAQTDGVAASPPAGTPAILVYLVAAVAALEAACAAGLRSPAECRSIELVLALVVASKALEVYYISNRRKYSAMVIFYILPPVLQSLVMVGAHLTIGGDGGTATVAGFVVGYAVALGAGLAGDRKGFAIFDPRRAGLGRHGLRAAVGAPALLFANGALLSLGEQLPTVLLRSLGASAAIPAFEVMRKICSVPATLVQAFGMHFNPDLISQIHAGDLRAFRATLVRYLAVAMTLGVLYVAGVAAAFWLDRHFGFLKGAEITTYWPLLAAALVTAGFAPIGAGLVALGGDRWWFYGAAGGVLALLSVTGGATVANALYTINSAVLAHVITLNAIVILGVTLLHRAVRAEPGFAGDRSGPVA
jgi:hypothetical protein